MAGRFSIVQNLWAVFVIEISLMLCVWVGEYVPPFLLKTPAEVCDVTNSSIVRKLIQKDWSPIVHRYGVSLPVECPFNLSRDFHGVRESVKSTRSSHWQCLKCGKKFYFERHLDLHIERRHSELINEAEDSVCLGHYCDIMRCEVLKSHSYLEDEAKTTDVSVWTPTSKRSSGGSGQGTKGYPPTLKAPPPQREQSLQKQSGEESSRMEECDESYYAKLRTSCIDLVWNCLQGLIGVLDAKEFQGIQSELESASCSYLSCSRYGDTYGPLGAKSKGKLRPFFIVFGSIFISLCLALAYYLTWIYTQTTTVSEDHTYYDGDYDKASTSADLLTVNKSQTAPLLNRTTHL